MFASEYSVYYALDDWFNSGGILCDLDRVIKLDVLKDAERASYQSLDPNSDDTITTYTFSTSQGCFPIEIRNESKKYNFVDEVNAVPQLISHGSEKVYFPKSISYKRAIDSNCTLGDLL